jgi:hypothetical protein
LLSDPAAINRGAKQYVNGNAFGLPALGTNGVYRLPYLPGPGYFDTDLTLAKRFRISEKTSMQLRGAAFNFINHANSSFTSVAPQGFTLNYNITANGADANQILAGARNQYSQFGYAPLREGRRIMELGLRFDF